MSGCMEVVLTVALVLVVRCVWCATLVLNVCMARISDNIVHRVAM